MEELMRAREYIRTAGGDLGTNAQMCLDAALLERANKSASRGSSPLRQSMEINDSAELVAKDPSQHLTQQSSNSESVTTRRLLRKQPRNESKHPKPELWQRCLHALAEPSSPAPMCRPARY